LRHPRPERGPGIWTIPPESTDVSPMGWLVDLNYPPYSTQGNPWLVCHESHSLGQPTSTRESAAREFHSGGRFASERITGFGGRSKFFPVPGGEVVKSKREHVDAKNDIQNTKLAHGKSMVTKEIRERGRGSDGKSSGHRVFAALTTRLPLTTGSSKSIASTTFLFLPVFRAGILDGSFVRCCFPSFSGETSY
jgi:hypothetical protein